MMLRRAIYLLSFLFISAAAGAQINIYLGGNLNGNYSWIRGDESTFQPGFGGGFNFVYWEHEYWFLKAGLDYDYKSSSRLDYPVVYDVPITDPDGKINITYYEQFVGVPLTIYFRPYESGDNTLLITGTLKTMYVIHLKANSEEYGEVVLKGAEMDSRIKTNVGFGVGYQRQLDRNIFLNIVPSFNFDIRSVRAFNSVTLTAELLFGVY